MRLLRPFTLAVILSCLCVAHAQSQGGSDERAHGGGGPGKPAKPEDYNRVFTIREITQRARLTRHPEPTYTPEARRKRIRGTVRLRLILRSDGHVDDKVEVLESLPYGLTDEAIKAAKQIEFEPAQKDGRKVSQYMLAEYDFDLL